MNAKTKVRNAASISHCELLSGLVPHESGLPITLYATRHVSEPKVLERRQSKHQQSEVISLLGLTLASLPQLSGKAPINAFLLKLRKTNCISNVKTLRANPFRVMFTCVHFWCITLVPCFILRMVRSEMMTCVTFKVSQLPMCSVEHSLTHASQHQSQHSVQSYKLMLGNSPVMLVEQWTAASSSSLID